MSKGYKVFVLDEGALIAVAVSDLMEGRGIVDGRVKYDISFTTLKEHTRTMIELMSREEDEKSVAEFKANVSSGKIFERILGDEGPCVFSLFGPEIGISLPEYIKVSEEIITAGGRGNDEKAIIQKRAVLDKYGYAYDEFPSNRETVEGLKEVLAMPSRNLDDLPITEIKPFKPPQGGGRSGGGARGR